MRCSLSLFLLALLTACPDTPGSGPRDPESGESTPPLIERAITALGGAERLARIRGVHTVSSSLERGLSRRVETTTALPDRCRVHIDTGLAHVAMGHDGKRAWSTLDGLPTEVRDSDEHSVAQHLAQVEMGLLVGLAEHEGCRIRERGTRDDLEWLEVRFRREDLGPYRLGFDPETALLTRLEWRGQVAGRDLDLALQLSDYRAVDGVMTAHRGIYSAGELVLAENTVESVRFGDASDFDAATFRATAPGKPDEAEPTEKICARAIQHECPKLHVAWMERGESDPEAVEKRLGQWIEEKGLIRNGPPLHLIEAGAVSRVAIPVEVPEATWTDADPEAEAELAELDPGFYLSVALHSPRKSRAEDFERLLAGLKEHIAPASDDASKRLVRCFIWPGDVIQLQVPTQAR